MARTGGRAHFVLIGGIAQVVAVVALIGFMFLPWYGLPSNFGGIGLGIDLGTTANAWESFSGTDAGLVLCALVVGGTGLALAIGGPLGMGRTAVRVLSIVALSFAAFAALAIVWKLIDPPSTLDLTRKYGAFLGLGATLVALAAAALPLFGQPAPVAAAPQAPVATPPGWYTDPDDPRRYRYWDGASWTDDFSPVG